MKQETDAMIAVLPSNDCLEESQVETHESYSAKSASKVSAVVDSSEVGSVPDADTVSLAVDGPRRWTGEEAR